MAEKMCLVFFFQIPVFTCSLNYALLNSVPLLRAPSFACNLHTCDLYNFFCVFACIDLNTQETFFHKSEQALLLRFNCVACLSVTKSQELPYGRGKIKTYLI